MLTNTALLKLHGTIKFEEHGAWYGEYFICEWTSFTGSLRYARIGVTREEAAGVILDELINYLWVKIQRCEEQ